MSTCICCDTPENVLQAPLANTSEGYLCIPCWDALDEREGQSRGWDPPTQGMIADPRWPATPRF